MSLASIQTGECFSYKVFIFIRVICCRPKAEALVRGLRHSVYCKKYDKSNAMQVYTDAYEENRLERVFK